MKKIIIAVAENPEEYEMYSWQACGMACLKMILKSIYPNEDFKLINLIKVIRFFRFINVLPKIKSFLITL